MCRKGICIGILILLTIGCACASPVFNSENPRLGKISLTQDDSKFLNIAFDESKGTGKGYDTLYADTNFNGRFDVSEKFSSGSQRSSRPDGRSHQTLELNTAFCRKSVSRPSSLYILWYPGPKRSSTNPSRDVLVGWSPQIVRGPVLSMTSRFNPFASTTKRACIFSGPRRSVIVTIRPDTAKRGNSGIGVNLHLGDWTVSSPFGSGFPTSLVIKGMDGKVAHRASGDMSKFGFG